MTGQPRVDVCSFGIRSTTLLSIANHVVLTAICLQCFCFQDTLYRSSWDHHSMLVPNLERNCSVVDQPIAALLKDLKRQGMLDETLVVCASECGRTPLGENKIGNTNASGRDHQPFSFSLWLAGGGIKPGQTVGATDEFGWNIIDNPIHMHDLHATILHQFGIDHERLTYRFRGRDVRLTDIYGRVLDEILA